jgi:hypothetical protein
VIEFSTCRALSEFLGAERIRPDYVELTPIAAVREALAWVNDGRPFISKHQRPWKSAIGDALAALSLLGPSVRAFLDVDLVRAGQILSSMAPKTQSQAKAYRVAARTALEPLLARFHEPEARTAAWEDLVRVAGDPSVDADAVAYRDRALHEVLEVTGHDFSAFASSARGVLDDSAREVAFVRVRLGEAGSHPWPLPADDAGLTEAERLDLCRRLLEMPATGGHQVVWLAFERASLDVRQFDVGSVRFFNCESVRTAWADPESPSYASLPHELISESDIGPRPLPEADNVVLVRVDLGEQFATTAVETARTVASSLVAVVQQTSHAQRWSLMKGYLHAVDGRLYRASSFGDEAAARHYAAWRDQTGLDLRNLPAVLASALPAAPGSRLEQVLDAVSWFSDSLERREPLVDIVMGVRVIELVSSWLPGAPSWEKTTTKFLLSWWARQELVHEAYNATHEALHPWTIGGLASEADQENLSALATRVIIRSDARTMTEMDQAIEALAKLDAVYPPASSVGRLVRRASASLASGSSALARIDSHKARFAVLLSRLVRCRNAIAHGGPLSIAVASTTTDFAQTLSRVVLRRALEAEATGKTVEVVLIDLRDRADSVLAALAAGSPPATALFTS